MIATITKKQFFTAEEYLEFEESKQEKYEFHHGKIRKMPGATTNHNIISANIIFAIKLALKEKQQKYYMLSSDTKIHIPKVQSFVYPDAVVIAEKIEHYKDRKDVIVNPLLVIEVLSDSTKGYDLGRKFEKYQTISSFKEYVLIEQAYPEIIAYHREATDLWRVQRNQDLEKGEIHLKSIDCKIALADIYDLIDWENEAIAD